MKQISDNKPLVYACSGCSNVAQLANDLALILNRKNLAEMSSIAGIGGNITEFIKTAQSGRSILAIDGCPLNCVKQCLATINVVPTWHIELTKFGFKKRAHEDYVVTDAYDLLELLPHEIVPNESRAINESHRQDTLDP
ncbi:putative zinc-binding protein [uncultured Rheinheimera sp.]|uniref:putative zinc-binding protein n=1 Tax=uncultured Rheinheimera sp. TaxID=400532 RepID=UPI002599F406|nr:putative zinc-binding protein [uncultured Rheinheimera sp.]